MFVIKKASPAVCLTMLPTDFFRCSANNTAQIQIDLLPQPQVAQPPQLHAAFGKWSELNLSVKQ